MAEPAIEIADCVRSFGLDASRWAEVCRRSAGFYARTAYVRFDPAERLAIGDRYQKAAEAIASGTAIAETGLRSLVPLLEVTRPAREVQVLLSEGARHEVVEFHQFWVLEGKTYLQTFDFSGKFRNRQFAS